MYSPSNSLSNSPSSYDKQVLFGIKILSDPNIGDNETYKTSLITELSTILSVSSDRFKISEFNIRLGKLYIYININSTTSDTNTNDRMSNLSLLELLGTTLSENIPNTFTILKDIDTTYGTNGVKLLKDNTIYTSLSSNIPKRTSNLDEIIDKNIPFALWTYVSNDSIPEISDKTKYKMYLTTSMTSDKYEPCKQDGILCKEDGMLSFNSELTIGAIYNLKKVTKYFPKNSDLYKYIDIDHITIDSFKRPIIASTFYNLSLNVNQYSVSYCQNGCHVDNKNGICAQEKITIGGNDKSSISGNKDMYNIKNYMKIKEEPDGTITPYFISLDPVEKIYFITNKLSTTEKPYDFKTIVQIPIYPPDNDEKEKKEKKGPYYERLQYNKTNNINYYEIVRTSITGLNNKYNDNLEQEYDNNEIRSFSSTETHAFKNTAYTDYAYSFYIEPITSQQIENLRK